MKKGSLVLLWVISVFLLTSCAAKTPANGDTPYFLAKVAQIENGTMLIQVTDEGNSGTAPGDQVRISAEKLSGVLATDRAMVLENFILIEFDGNVMETYPLQLGEIFQIIVTDETGTPIE